LKLIRRREKGHIGPDDQNAVRIEDIGIIQQYNSALDFVIREKSKEGY
jgi:hypothetical protein